MIIIQKNEEDKINASHSWKEQISGQEEERKREKKKGIIQWLKANATQKTPQLQPQNPSHTRDCTPQDPPKELERHDNQPHPPEHPDQSPFKHHKSRAPQPAEPAVALADSPVERVAELFHSERARRVELDAQRLGFLRRGTDARVDRLIDRVL